MTSHKAAEVPPPRQLQELNILHAVAAACAESKDEYTLIERITYILDQFLAADNFGILLVQESSSGSSSLWVHPTYQGDHASLPESIHLAEKITGLVAENGQNIFIPNFKKQTHFTSADCFQPLAASILCVPIKIDHRVLGAINTESLQANAYTLEDERLLVTVANLIATSIEHIRAEDLARQHVQELLAVTRISQEVTSMLDQQEVLDSIVRHAAEISHSDASGLFFLNTDGRFYLKASYGVGQKFVQLVNEKGISKQGTAIGSAVLQRRPYQIPDIRHSPGYQAEDLADIEGIRAVLALPMLHDTEVLGGIVIWDRKPRHFTSEEKLFLQVLANQGVNAVHNALLFEAEHERRQVAEVLREAGSVLSAILDASTLFDRLLDQLARLVPYDTASIMLVEHGIAKVVHTRGFEQFGPDAPKKISRVVFNIEKTGNLRHMLKSKKPFLIPDTRQYPDWIKFDEQYPIYSWTGAPVLVGNTVIAFFSLDKGTPYFYEEKHLERLGIIAGQAGLALQNAHLFDEMHRRAFQQQVLNKIISAAVTAISLPELLETSLGLTLSALGLKKGGIWGGAHRSLCNLPKDIGIAGLQTTLTNQEILVINDWQQITAEHPLYVWSTHLIQAGVNASLFLPLVASNKQVGLLFLASEAPVAWSAEDIALVEAIGKQLSSAAERMELMEKTQEQARQMQQIMDTVPEGVLLLDADRIIRLANPIAQEYIPILTGDINFEHPLTHLGNQLLDAWLESSTSPKAHSAWQEVETREAKPRIFEVAAQPLKTEAGLAGWVLVLRDVTVERENQSRTQMQERLATVGQLAAGIAHDFNNIMAAILVYVDLLAMEPGLSNANQERLVIIQKQIQRASSLIRQILDFSRRTVIEEAPLDLLPFVKEMDKLLKRVLPETIRLELVYQPDIYMIKADATRLQQVLMNLSVNARDAMPSGGILRFELSKFILSPGEPPPFSDLTPGVWVCLKVIDSGVGIPAEHLARIFDPFFTTKAIGKGTGLGLAQVYGIIKRHNGHIYVSSKANEGATFTLYLPALEAIPEETTHIDTAVMSKGNGETILIVEDDGAARYALQAFLESQNYRAVTAINGIEALRLYEQENTAIALVVSDVVMPEMDGISLYQTLRKKQPDIRFLFITGHPLDLEKQVSGEIKRATWLQKPFGVKEFSAAIRKLLSP